MMHCQKNIKCRTGFQISGSYICYYIKKELHSGDTFGNKNRQKYKFLEFNKKTGVKKTQQYFLQVLKYKECSTSLETARDNLLRAISCLLFSP